MCYESLEKGYIYDVNQISKTTTFFCFAVKLLSPSPPKGLEPRGSVKSCRRLPYMASLGMRLSTTASKPYDANI